MEFCDVVQETGIKTIPMEKKWKKAKWLSGEALQIAVKRKEVKGKGEKESYTHLNAEFQRIARRDKTAFLSNQCKRERKTIGWERLEISSSKLEIPRAFHAKMSTVKGRNGWTKKKEMDGPKRSRIDEEAVSGIHRGTTQNRS